MVRVGLWTAGGHRPAGIIRRGFSVRRRTVGRRKRRDGACSVVGEALREVVDYAAWRR
jgi:hypothetical protein